MRTVDRLSSNASLSWMRSQADRLRRALPARRRAVRLSLVLALAAGLAAVGYWTAMAWAPVSTRYLASGRSLSSEDLKKVRRALEAKEIEYRIDGRRVEVAADQFDQATAAFAKLDVGPQPFDELRKPPDPLSLLVETPDDRYRKELLVREKRLAAYIDDLEGVVWSLVTIEYPRGKAGWHSRAKPSAFVYVESEADHLLPSRAVQSILTILMTNVPDLSSESIAVMGRDGHTYYDPRNPALGDHSRDRALEEELREEILKKIAWIKGVQVSVDLLDRCGAEPAEAQAQLVPLKPSVADPEPAIGVNRPLQLNPEDEPESPSPPPPAPADVAAAAKLTARGSRPSERGRVLIYVPRSYYLKAAYPKADRREPSLDELHRMAARTREQILKAVNRVISQSWVVDVETIPDDDLLGRPAALASVSEPRRKVLEWGIGAAVGAAIAVLTALGSWIQVARRPARSHGPAPDAPRYRTDSAAEPGPSERVRELVRRDPEAAASVLQRWTTQGGPVS